MTKNDETTPSEDVSAEPASLELSEAALKKMQELIDAPARPSARLRAAARRHEAEAQARGRSSAQRRPSGGRNQ